MTGNGFYLPPIKICKKGDDLGMVKIYKNGDDLGMVYCFNHIMGYFITNIMAEHPIGPPKIPMPLWDPWSGVQDYCNSNPGTTSTLLEM